MHCVVCGKTARRRALCGTCGEAISTEDRLAPEQLWVVCDAPINAAVIDQWGRAHPLGRRTIVARQPGPETLTICDGSVSRNHAVIDCVPEEARFTVRDLGSTNGTFLREKPLEGETELVSGDTIHFGSVGMYFVTPAPETEAVSGYVSAATLRVPMPNSREEFIGERQPPDDEDEENTSVGMPRMKIEMHEPTGGGGGILEAADRRCQLTVIQAELMQTLIERMRGGKGESELVRGFVRSSELIGTLSWETPAPNENHVKQLVRRTRRALDKAEIRDLIESRHRLGYRLKAIPE